MATQKTEIELIDGIAQMIRVESHKTGAGVLAEKILAATRSAGYVQLSENQDTPSCESCVHGSEGVIPQTAKCFEFVGYCGLFNKWQPVLAPDANGEAFRRVRLPKEGVK